MELQEKQIVQGKLVCSRAKVSRNTRSGEEYNLLSLVGSGFFSCVSVFFSLVLSNVVTSDTSGLSLIVAGCLKLACCLERENTITAAKWKKNTIFLMT